MLIYKFIILYCRVCYIHLRDLKKNELFHKLYIAAAPLFTFCLKHMVLGYVYMTAIKNRKDFPLCFSQTDNNIVKMKMLYYTSRLRKFAFL